MEVIRLERLFGLQGTLRARLHPFQETVDVIGGDFSNGGVWREKTCKQIEVPDESFNGEDATFPGRKRNLPMIGLPVKTEYQQ